MSEGTIDYTKIVNSAMQQVVREVLKFVSVTKKCNLLLSFSTRNKKVIIPDTLRQQYAEKMSIILNNQFSNLIVSDVGFSVNLTFSGLEKKLFIPFSSLIYFCDRDVKFSIEFKNYDNGDEASSHDMDHLLNTNVVDNVKNETYKKGKIIYFSQFLKHETKDKT